MTISEGGVTKGPWMTSALPSPRSNMFPIVNADGRVIALVVRREDAEFIAAARRERREPGKSPIGQAIGIKMECLHEHIGSAWVALRNEGRNVGDAAELPMFSIGSVEYHLQAIEEAAGALFQLLAKVSPAVGDT